MRRTQNSRSHGYTRRVGSLLAVALLAVLAGVAPTASASETCLNEQLREENNSTSLPDCRAYELVSPGHEKEGGVLAQWPFALLSQNGEGLLYEALTAFGDATNGGGPFGEIYYRAARTSMGWLSKAYTLPPPPEPQSSLDNYLLKPEQASRDLSTLLLVVGGSVRSPDSPMGAWAVRVGEAPLSVGANTEGGTSQYVPVYSSDDASHIIVSGQGASTPMSGGPLSQGASALYDYWGGERHLVNVDANGDLLSPDGASLPNHTTANNPVSRDGSRIFFYSPVPLPGGANAHQLYARVDGQRTIALSESRHSAPQPEVKSVVFAGASADGTRVFFVTEEQLLDEAAGAGPFLYEYELPAGAQSGTLRLIAGVANPVAVTEQGTLPQVLVSEDGSHVYYESTVGAGSLYVYHTSGPEAGQTRLIAEEVGSGRVLAGPMEDIGAKDAPAQASDDGTHVVFRSAGDPLHATQNKGLKIYKYDDEGEHRLTLIAGGYPSGKDFDSVLVVGDYMEVEYMDPKQEFGAVRRWRDYHSVSNDGHTVFFQSDEGLVPQDTNGMTDVYEWHDGHVSLLSAGTGPNGSYFMGADSQAANALITTRDNLVPGRDGDESWDYYDARIDGGFPTPQSDEEPCFEEGCQGEVSPAPALATPSTVSFIGEGNTLPIRAVLRPHLRLRYTRRRGHTIVLRLAIPARGRVLGSGWGVSSAFKNVSRAGTCTLRLRLSNRSLAKLRHRSRLTLHVQVEYIAAAGEKTSIRKRLIVRGPIR